MPAPLGELITPEVAAWLYHSAFRDSLRQKREQGRPFPPFRDEVLSALLAAAGRPAPASTGGGTRLRIVDSGQWVPLSVAADAAGLSSSYLRRLARAGRIRAKKVGPCWSVDTDSLPWRANDQHERSAAG